MPTIRVLPDDLASQVAAGEVVERPAAAVKELIENSIDAGASQIDVQIDKGGSSLIRVADDGCGMAKEDALLSIKRHATSKIRTRDDLDRIRTLGFRGEAVPSIASVSRFRLMTREADAVAGVELRIDGGNLVEVRDYGGPPGTVIEARNLFYCVPGRRKFLRAEATEASHVEHQIRLHAVGSPKVGFTFQKNGREVFRLPPAVGLRERIHGLAGGDLATRLLEVPRHEGKDVSLHGLIAPPDLARRDRQFCLCFLNGRPIDAKQVGYALREAFGGQVARGLSPVAFLFLEIDPALVDVNVHPAKREVRFRDGRSVQEAIITAVQSALSGGARTTFHGNEPVAPHPPTYEPTPTAPSSPGPILPAAFQRPQGTFQADLPSSAPAPARSSPAPTSPPSTGTRLGPASQTTAVPITDSFEIHGILQNGVALLESGEGLVLMDLRAAHERVLYEEMLSLDQDSGEASAQQLLVPEILELGAQDFEALLEHQTRLQELGFGIEEFGSNTVRLHSLPGFLGDKDPAQLLRDVLGDLRQGSRGTSDWEAALATRASRRAVPSSRKFSDDEVSDLIESLLACELPYCAPGGRPTLVQFSFQELDRRLGRT